METTRPVLDLSFQAQLIANTVSVGLLLATLGYAVLTARRERKLYPYFLFIGAGASVYLEPFVDVLGKCLMADGPNVLVVFRAFGRGMPLYLCLLYFVYWGTAVLFLMGRLQAGMTERQWLRFYGIGIMAAACFEPLLIRTDMWTYYGGNQPVKFFGLPLWWCFVNAHAFFLTAALFHFLRTRILTDRQSYVLAFLFPVVLPMTYGAALPIFTALNTTDNRLITNAAGVLTMGIAAMNVRLCGRLLAGRLPQKQDSLPRQYA